MNAKTHKTVGPIKATSQLAVRAVLDEIKIARMMGHRISETDLCRTYGKDNVDRARLDRRYDFAMLVK